MAQQVANAKIRINSDTKKAERGLKSLTGAVKGVVAGFGGMVILKKINGFLQETSRLAGIQIQAEQKLQAALGRTSKSLLQYASELQNQTTFGDEAIIESQALVAAFIKEEEQIKKLMPAILDLASAKGMDLRSAADLVTKSVVSSTNSLSRYGIQIDGAAGSTERAESAVRAINDAFGGMAEELAKTDIGRLEQIQNRIGDIKEEIGRGVLPYQIKWNELILKGHEGLNSILFTLGKIREDPEVIKLDITTKQIRVLKEEFSTIKDALDSTTDDVIALTDEFGNFRKTTRGAAEVELRIIQEDIDKLVQKADKLRGNIFGTGDTGGKKPPKEVITTSGGSNAKAVSSQVDEVQTMADTILDIQRATRDAELEMEFEAEDRRTEFLKERRMSQLDSIDAFYSERRDKLNKLLEDGAISEEEHLSEMDELNKDYTQARINEAEKLRDIQQSATLQTVSSFIGALGKANEASEGNAKVVKRLAQLQALVDTYAAANGAFRAMANIPYVGPALGAAAAVAATIAGLANVAMIEKAKFQTGGLVGNISRFRNDDNVNAMVGQGEFIMPAPQTARNLELLEAIRNNTAGSRMTGTGAQYNFYGLSTEQVRQVIREDSRRNRTGTLI